MHSISKKSSSFKTLTRRSQNMAKEHQQQQQVESDSPSCSPEVGDDVIDSDYEDNNNHKFDNDDEHQDVDVMSSPPPQMQVKNEESNEINRPFNTARPMKRRKSSSPDRDHRAGVNNQAGAATGDSDWAPRIKREANKLNFSIESIMQSVNQSSSSVVANQLQQQTQLQHQLLQQQQHQATINPSYPANFPPGLSGYLQIQTSAAATAALAAAAAATATPMGQQQQQRQQSMASPSFLPSHQNHRLNNHQQHHHQQHQQVAMADPSPMRASNANHSHNHNNNNIAADSPTFAAYSPPLSSSLSRQSSPTPSIGSGTQSIDKSTIIHKTTINEPTTGNQSLAQVECTLDNKDMWDKFHSLNTEMIITKTGRRMFPVMKVQFHHLDPNARYAVSMDIVPVDNKRYRYAYHKSCWQMAGKADPSAEPRLYPHPDSPFNGDLLSRQVISFEKVKLTNNEMDRSGHIILNSMHKYQPRVHLIELKLPPTNAPPPSQQANIAQQHHHQQQSLNLNQSTSNGRNNQNHRSTNNNNLPPQQPQLDIKGYRTFVFPETVFTAVTAYQNQLITKMKIDKNPFAKGFRDSSRLSDLDRNDPFDYMGSLGPGGPMDPATAAAAAAMAAGGAHMDAYQQLLAASTANQNPWYSAVAAATGAAANPFANPMAAAACSNASAQAAQLQATQMWLAAFSACLNGGPGGAGGLPPKGITPGGNGGGGGTRHSSASPHTNTVL